ncbi:MAG: hypothetical protein QHI48_03760 [Bacteroidota bacterium]|nr:hypothetical protein [Bacteroidota bacterium]
MKRGIVFSIVFYLLSFTAAAQNFSGYPIVVRPFEAEVNSPSDDYAPAVTADRSTLYFTSYRKTGSRGEADIFRTQRVGNAWTVAENAGTDFNTEGNDGAMVVTPEGRVLFASDGRPGGFGDTDIWSAYLSGGTLTGIRNLGPRVNTKHWESQPAVTGDGRTIIFASDRPGGAGGTDLWAVTCDDWANCSEPKPLPRWINTKGNECSPYLTPDGGTLYFASNGLAGYGGYDIWMTMYENGTWTHPVNLGPVVNSDKDDMFFHAPAKDQDFYLASSRRGGYGGLDVYVGTPNVFGKGMFRLTVSVLDSVSRKPLPSLVTIIDAETGNVLTSFVTNTQAAEYTEILPADRAYRVEAVIRDYPKRAADVTETRANTEQSVVLLFGPITVAEFDLGRYNIPFFVTGYYRPNTRASLEDLFTRLQGELSSATYIERFPRQSRRHQQYIAYAETVESIFRTVYTAGVEEIFPRFAAQGLPSEILEIKVVGYADPQPIIGRYLEDETVTFADMRGNTHTVSKGDVLDNLKLSGLRAWHSYLYLDRLFREAASEGHREYLDLKEAGRIRYSIVGGDVSNDNTDYASQRRIRITMTRVGAYETRGRDTDFDLNKDFRR